MKNTLEDRKETQLAHQEGNQHAPLWTIPAASGRESIICQKIQNLESELILCCVHISGSNWDRRLPLSQATLAPDFAISLEQVVLSRMSLLALRLQLTAWFVNPMEFSCELCDPSDRYQSLVISFAVEEGVICSLDKPACTIEYRHGFLDTRCTFVVDQSCLNILLQSLVDV